MAEPTSEPLADKATVDTAGDRSLDALLNANFAGRVVRKDLTKLVKEGANVPVYVLEYLLGTYCASDDGDDSRRAQHRQADPGRELRPARRGREGQVARSGSGAASRSSTR